MGNIWQCAPFDEIIHLLCIQDFPLQNSIGQAVERFHALANDSASPLVIFGNNPRNLFIDFDGSFLIVIPMLGDLAAPKDLLFLLGEGQRSQIAHAVHAHHLAGPLGGKFDVVFGAGGLVAEDDSSAARPPIRT